MGFQCIFQHFLLICTKASLIAYLKHRYFDYVYTFKYFPTPFQVLRHKKTNNPKNESKDNLYQTIIGESHDDCGI